MSPRLFRLPESRRRAVVDVDREIAFHLAMCEADLVAAGHSPDAARLEARRRFGDPATIGAEMLAEEGARQARLRRADRLDALRRDVVHALRTLRRAPGFAAAAVLTLALGIGATTAVFGVVDGVLLRALPLPDAARVVALVPNVSGEPRNGTPAYLFAWAERSRTLRRVAAFTERRATLLVGPEPERVTGAAVSGAFFDVLGAPPALGRALRPDDDAPGAAPVVVLSHRLWTRAFAASPAAVGRTVSLDGRARTVVGVMPQSFDAMAATEFWVPLALPPSQRDNFTPYLQLVGRLAPGATSAGASSELGALVAGLGPRAADDGVVPAVVAEPLDRFLFAEYRAPLLLLLGAAGAVLLIGCANVSTLVLARSVTRAREMAVRASLGAGRGRLARQLLAEHLVLGALAAAAALPVAALSLRALVAAIPAEVPRLGDVGLDARAFAVAALLGAAAGVLCGLAPALHQRRLDVGAVLQGGTRTAGDRRGDRWRRLFVGAEVALAFALLAGAGLLLRSASALGRVRPGYDVERVLTARLALPPRDYALPAALRAFDAIADAARRQPGVEAAALVSRVPLGGAATGVDVSLTGSEPQARVGAAMRIASAGYFRAMGIPLLAGRDLAATDDERAPAVVVVSASLARRLGGGAAVVGRRLVSPNGAFADSSGAPRPMEIVGVVADVRDGGPRAEPDPTFFAPMAQVSEEPWDYWIEREMLLVARASGGVAHGDPARLAPALRRAVASVDPRLPLYDVQTTGERVARVLAVDRLETRLLTVLGILGVALAALGIHGVVAYAVSRRTREVGVRLALGASAREAVGVVLRQSLRPVVVGLAVGGAVALVGARAVTGFLFGVSPHDPVTLLGAAAVLGAAALAACVGPARRAARVDPATTLRADG